MSLWCFVRWRWTHSYLASSVQKWKEWLEHHFAHRHLLSSCAFSWNVCVISPGGAADEEDWCRGGQTNRVWDEYCISASWSADYEGNSCNSQPVVLRLLSDMTFYQTTVFTVLSLPAGDLERHSRSGWDYKWAARHSHPAVSEKTSFSRIQTLSAS